MTVWFDIPSLFVFSYIVLADRTNGRANATVLRLSTCSSVVFHLSVVLRNVGPYCGYKTVRPRAKVIIDSLQEVVCEKSISIKMNGLDLCLEVMSNIVSHSTLNISETIRDRGLVPKDRQYEMAYGGSNGTDDVT